MRPLVSILIPAYNAEMWIGEAVESALAQTWANKEIIVVDDGSKDQTLAVALSFERLGVRVVSQSNQGASAARNKAFSLCHGDYIQWLDADDLLEPDKVAAQVAAIGSTANGRTILASAWGRFSHRPHRATLIPNSLWYDLSPAEWMIRKMEDNAWMAIQAWLISRQLTEEVGPWDASLSMDDDGEYFSRIVCASDRVVFVIGAKSYVRNANPRSLSSSLFSPGKLESQFRSMTLQIERLRALDDSARARAACVKYLEGFFMYFRPRRENFSIQARALAADLGGVLRIPALDRKYRLLQFLIGARLAKNASVVLPRVRARCAQQWDWLLWRLDF